MDFYSIQYSHSKTVQRYCRWKNPGRFSARAASEDDGMTFSIPWYLLKKHTHAPNKEDVEALGLLTSMKGREFEHP